MKFFRKAIVLIAVLACAGFAYWYFEVKRGREKEEEKQKEALLFESTERTVEKLVIKGEDKPEIVMERVAKGEDAVWIITSPVETRGDGYAAEAIISMIKEGKREEVVWESLEKEKEYGLEEPRQYLRFYYKGDSETHGIDFGIENLDRKKVFAKVAGRDKIFSVPVEFRAAVIKSLFDMRDKTLAHFKSENVEKISYLSASGAFMLAREGEEWYLLPERVKASKIRVELYTGSFTYGNFVEVEEERGENLEKYGLDKPRMIVNLRMKDESNYMFIVGNSVSVGESEYYYATRSTDGMIFQVKPDVVSGLAKNAFELRDRKIFDFEDAEVSAITLNSKDISFPLIREDDEWKFQDTGEKIEREYMVDGILRGIKNSEYEVIEPVKREDEIWEKTGIENPVYEVIFTFNSGRAPLTVQMTGMNEQTSMLWITSDNGDTVYYTSGYFMSNFPKKRDDLLEWEM